ncbi:MAG: sugar nucleotide-binding protein [Candidatus Bathyarchaeia archaeon]
MHSAAMTSVDKCEEDKDLACKINVKGTKNIAELSHKLLCGLTMPIRC